MVASWTALITWLIATGATRASCRPITVSPMRRLTDASVSRSPASRISRRNRNGVRRSIATRSVSATIPITLRRVSSTGRWRSPRSSISSSTSVPVVSADTVCAGTVMIAETGVSGGTAAATTRLRKSESVTMPRRSPRSTSSELEPAATISRAASRSDASGETITAGRRTSSPTGRRAGSSIAASSSSGGRRRTSTRPARERTTKPSASGAVRNGRMASSAMR